MNFEDTIIAPATIPGTGAISLVRISGPSALSVADALVSFKRGNAISSCSGRLKFGSITKDGALLDEVMVGIYRAPHSYTGEDSVEISCHASAYIVSEILTLALSAGARMALPGEFTQRAFVNGKMDLSQAEAVADVISSDDKASHDLAFRQLKGGVAMEISKLRSELLKMTSLLELELDFSDEDVEFADRTELESLLKHAVEHVSSLAASFRLGNAVKNGIPVAIVGAANAGKSTLLNRILGEERAIVSAVPGTTRDTVEECFNIDGIKYRLIDTAGIRKSDDEVEKIGMLRSFDSVAKAEIVILVIDAGESFEESLSEIIGHLDFGAQKVIFALNKADKYEDLGVNIFVISKNKIVSLLKSQGVSAEQCCICQISAKTGQGVGNLLDLLSGYEKKRISSTVGTASVTITNLRHYEALSTALSQLSSALESLRSGLSSELVSEDLRAALRTLGTITGEITTNEVLGEIFGRFCIGK